MGFFDFLRGPDLDAGLQECRADPRALLLDVRTPEEYRAGRIPGSRSLPLQELNGVAALAPGKDAALPLLPQRRPGRAGRRHAAAHGLHPCEESGRDHRLPRKGGTIK